MADEADTLMRAAGAEVPALLAAVISSTDEAIYSKTIDGFISSWNPAAERLYGYTDQEARGQHISMLIPPHRKGEERLILEKVLGGDRVDHYETERMRKDGAIVHVALTASALRLDDGEIIGVAVVGRDITAERRLREEGEAIAEDRSRLAAIVEGSDDAILSKTTDGIVTSWNRGAEALYGYSADEIIGQPVSLVIPDHLRGEEREILRTVLRGERLEHYRTQRLTRDGRLVDVSITVSPIRNGAGEIVGASTIARDITELERNRRDLQDANERLEYAGAMKNHFVAMTSHELRTPMTSIAGFAHTLRQRWDHLPDEEKLRYITVIDEQADRMLRLIADLLTVSRISAGTVEPRRQVLRVAERIRSAALVAMGSEEARLRIECAEDLETCVDADHLEQILVNLLANARKYGASPYVVGAVPSGGDVFVRVIDHGPGVSAVFRDRMFDEFSQVDHYQSGSGTGLGLSIARGLARAQDGDLWYEDHDEAGACFVLRIPAA